MRRAIQLFCFPSQLLQFQWNGCCNLCHFPLQVQVVSSRRMIKRVLGCGVDQTRKKVNKDEQRRATWAEGSSSNSKKLQENQRKASSLYSGSECECGCLPVLFVTVAFQLGVPKSRDIVFRPKSVFRNVALLSTLFACS